MSNTKMEMMMLEVPPEVEKADPVLAKLLARPPSKTTRRIIALMKHGFRFILVGPPGQAKTSMILLASFLTGRKLEITAAGTRERVDFSGAIMPDPKEGYAREFLLETMYRLKHADTPVTWFLDDIGNADKDVQAAIKSQITRGGVIANNPNVYICAATNRPKDQTGVRHLHGSLLSEFRFGFHMPTPDMDKKEHQSEGVYLCGWPEFVESWCEWSMDYGADAPITAWIRNAGVGGADMPSQLYNWQPNADPAVRYADCRTWQAVIDAWNAGLRDAWALGAAIGQVNANSFLAFAELQHDLPTIKDIIKDPEGCSVPGEDTSGALYLLVSIIAGKIEPSWVNEMITYMYRLPRPYQGLLMRDTHRRLGKALSKHPKWMKLFADNMEIFTSSSYERK